jgi:hypothetical protein
MYQLDHGLAFRMAVTGSYPASCSSFKRLLQEQGATVMLIGGRHGDAGRRTKGACTCAQDQERYLRAVPSPKPLSAPGSVSASAFLYSQGMGCS